MGISKTSNGKFRVFVSVKGRGRKTATCDTHDDALAKEDALRKALIDGKNVPAGRARTEATLQQACEACYEDPETGWKDTEHGKKQKYYFSKFYSFWGKDKLLREIDKTEWYKFTAQFSETATKNRRD